MSDGHGHHHQPAQTGDGSAEPETVKRKLKEMLCEEFHIAHSTLEQEWPEGCCGGRGSCAG